MEIAPNNLEVCLKLNRFVCSEAENDVVAPTDSRVRILSSHELATVTTVALPAAPGVLGEQFQTPSKPPVLQERSKTKTIAASESTEKIGTEDCDENAVFIDGAVEEFPKRKSAKFLRMLNQERRIRWTAEQSSLPVDGTDPASREHSSRISKGMHIPPKFDAADLNPIRQPDQLAKQIRDQMFLDILAQQRNQKAGDNMSQVSGMSAKERILKTGHATGLPNYLRQL